MREPVIFHEHILEAAAQKGISVEDACLQAKEMGYFGVNMDFNRLKEDFEGTMQPLQNAGLQVHCVYVHNHFGLEEDCEEADLASGKACVELVKKCGSKNMLTIAGFLREHEMDRNSEAYRIRREQVKKSVAALAQECKKNGIQLVMEDFDGKQALFCFADELFDFVSTVPDLTCAFDTGNFMYGCEDAWALLPKFLPYITDIHLKDRGLEKNDGNPCIAIDGTPLYPVPVGDGVLPMKEIMETLLQNGYTGNFAAEHFGSGDQMRDMQKSIDFIRKVVG